MVTHSYSYDPNRIREILNRVLDIKREADKMADELYEKTAQGLRDKADEVKERVGNLQWKNTKAEFGEALKRIKVEFELAAIQGPGYGGGGKLTRHALPNYVKGGFDIQLEEQSNTDFLGSVTVLDKEAARLSEDQIDPWDMKQALLHGKNAKIGKNGKPYNTILMRHQTPGTVGLTGAPMPNEIYGSKKNPLARGMEAWEYEGISSETNKEGYSINAGRLLRNEGGAKARLVHRGDVLTSEGVRTPEGDVIGLPTRRNPKTKSSAVETMGRTGSHAFVEGRGGEYVEHFYRHKTSIYEGMRRMTMKYESARQQFYVTFRRVSEKSAPDSWWHNGLSKNDIPAAIAPECQRIVKEHIDRGLLQDLDIALTGFMRGQNNG